MFGTPISLSAWTLVECVSKQMKLWQQEKHPVQPNGLEVGDVGLIFHLTSHFEMKIMMSRVHLDVFPLIFLMSPLQSYKHHIFQSPP